MSSKKFIIGSIIIWIIIIALLVTNIPKKESKKKLEKEKISVETIVKNYNDLVKTKENAILYKKEEDKYKEYIKIYGTVELKLDETTKQEEYFKVLDSDLYIHYDMIEKIDNLTPKTGEYKTYKNYLPYNENITLKENAKLYIDDNNYYQLTTTESFPIIIKEEQKYGIEYNNNLVYVKEEDIEKIEEANNTDKEETTRIAVLNYHYTVSSTNENGELDECRQEICITDTMFDKHINYLKENNYYGATIRDLELYIDDKIKLPENTVLITIDDGWYVARSITILNKYEFQGTLFLIGSLASPDAYRSEYLEIHSHTWDMHKLGQCPVSVGRGGILCLDEETILEDLRKSRESLNNTTYFCYPFYDYNKRAINLLKQAGFTMAFIGGDKKVRKGQDKFTIPRYVIVNYTSMNNFINMVS